MAKVVVIGGGWAGSGAAISAKKAGADVVLLERTDMLLGSGLVGGIMRNNGRYTATEEMIAMGGGELFQATDNTARHRNIDFPAHKHASLYDVALIEPAVKKILLDLEIEIHTESRVKDVEADGKKIIAVVTADGRRFEGDVFVECTGTAGPQGSCTRYGNGCAMCVYRCPSYGPRVSIAAKMGIKEMMAKKADGTYGAMSGSCKLLKESLSEDIVEMLDTTGVAVIPVPEHAKEDSEILTKKACQQYALEDYVENVVLLDTGHAKLMTPFFPLNDLRQIPGFENARYEDPYAGNLGNSMRYLAISPRDNCLKTIGLENLFCAGEKAGPLVGHTEAICTGTLAGANAVRWASDAELIELPDELAIGDAIAYVKEQMKTEEGISKKYTFSGSVYFERMKERGLYTTKIDEIRERVERAGMTDVFKQKVV